MLAYRSIDREPWSNSAEDDHDFTSAECGHDLAPSYWLLLTLEKNETKKYGKSIPVISTGGTIYMAQS